MPADLRTRLKALVEEWGRHGGWSSDDFEAGKSQAYEQCADQLSAILAESEPEPSFRDITATRCPRHATIPPTILPPASQECGLCMREEGILVGRAEQSQERAWLIESRFTPAPSWWTGTGWSRDSLDAVRFSRRRDAEACAAALPDFHTCFPTEHLWGLGGPERPGCGRDHGGGSWNANCPDCEAKAKLPLPLGHPYEGPRDGRYCLAIYLQRDGKRYCGQLRSAHEAKIVCRHCKQGHGATETCGVLVGDKIVPRT